MAQALDIWHKSWPRFSMIGHIIHRALMWSMCSRYEAVYCRFFFFFWKKQCHIGSDGCSEEMWYHNHLCAMHEWLDRAAFWINHVSWRLPHSWRVRTKQKLQGFELFRKIVLYTALQVVWVTNMGSSQSKHEATRRLIKLQHRRISISFWSCYFNTN